MMDYYTRQRLEMLRNLGQISPDKCDSAAAETVAVTFEYNLDFGSNIRSYMEAMKREQIDRCRLVLLKQFEDYASKGGNLKVARLRQFVESAPATRQKSGSLSKKSPKSGSSSSSSSSSTLADTADTQHGNNKLYVHVSSEQIFNGLVKFLVANSNEPSPTSLIKRIHLRDTHKRNLADLFEECERVNQDLAKGLEIYETFGELDSEDKPLNAKIREQLVEARICGHLKYFNQEATKRLYSVLKLPDPDLKYSSTGFD